MNGEIAKKILFYIKKLELLVGDMSSSVALFCFIFGIFLVGQQIEIWSWSWLWGEKSLLELLAAHGKDQQVTVGSFLFVLGFCVLVGKILAPITKKTTFLLSSIKAVSKAEELGKIDEETKERHLKSILGTTVVESFLYWLADEKHIKAKFASKLVELWRDYLEKQGTL